jgi:hypothetical protein
LTDVIICKLSDDQKAVIYEIKAGIWPYRRESIEAIERALNLETPDGNIRGELQTLLAFFLEQEKTKRVLLNAKRRALARVEKAASALGKALSDPALESDDTLAEVLWQGDRKIDELVDFGSAAKYVARLSREVPNILDNIGRQKDKGSPPNSARHFRLGEMSDFEFEKTGKRTRYSYKDDPRTLSGTLFLMFKAVEEAVARKSNKRVPIDKTIAQFIYRSQVGPRKPHKRTISADS